MSARETTSKLIAAGRAAGFSSCGIASCERSDHAAKLDAWLARGAHAGMEWMARTAETRKELTSKWTALHSSARSRI